MDQMKKFAAYLILMLSGIYFNAYELIAQSPTNIDTRKKDPEPFTLIDYLVYIGFPILMVILVIWYRYYRKKIAEKENSQKRAEE